MKAPANICFVGLGYIGLPTAVTMADSGLNVIGVDIKREYVDSINQGNSGINEPGLDELLQKTLDAGTFSATTEMPSADAYIIAVPTPFDEDYNIDMKYIFSASESIAPVLKGGELIVLESTSSPLTTEKMAERILSLRPDLNADEPNIEPSANTIYFAHCPERILPGQALEELKSNDRIIGGMTPRASELATSVYSSFCQGELLQTDATTAELAKLTENSFRDVNIAFANELSLICDRLGIDVWELIELANHHPRVNILQPGPGVGGHCIAVDPWFIVSSMPDLARVIRTAREVNDSKPNWVVEKVLEALKDSPEAKVAVLGLAFKANIEDLRESPSLEIAKALATTAVGTEFAVVEPNVKELPESLKTLPNVEFADVDNAVSAADIVLLLVDHKEFKNFDIRNLEGKKVIDTKGIWKEA